VLGLVSPWTRIQRFRPFHEAAPVLRRSPCKEHAGRRDVDTERAQGLHVEVLVESRDVIRTTSQVAQSRATNLPS